MHGAEVMLLGIGAAFVVAGAIAISWPFGFLVTGLLMLLAAVDLRR